MRQSRIVVLGAGVTGLTCAHEIQKKAKASGNAVEVVVLEASGRVGGKILTEVKGGVTYEAGPDSFISLKPQGLELARELGLESSLMPSDPRHTDLFVYSRGKMRRMPAGLKLVVPSRLIPFLMTDVLSWLGKLRVGLEPFIPAGSSEVDESLGQFLRRRLGREALERIAAPLLAGIYAGDPEALSLDSTFPQLREMERQGGLIRSARRKVAGGAKASKGFSMFVSLRGGMTRMTDELCRGLPDGHVVLDSPVTRIERRGDFWRVHAKGGTFTADAVVSTLPAHALAGVLEEEDLELACVLREIPFASTATASLLYGRKGFPRQLNGYGFIVPRTEGKAISAATYVSSKFPSRVPDGKVLVRAFIGGAGREGPALQAEPGIASLARTELTEMLSLGKTSPEHVQVYRWPTSNPQYTVGHALRLKRIESCVKGHRGLVLAGCSYRGVGIPDCIQSGRAAAAKALAALESKQAAVV